MNILLKPSPETFGKIPACKKEIKASRQKTVCVLSLQGELAPFPSSSPTSFFTGTSLLDSKALGSWLLVPETPETFP